MATSKMKNRIKKLRNDLENDYNLECDAWGNYKFTTFSTTLRRVKIAKNVWKIETKVGNRWVRNFSFSIMKDDASAADTLLNNCTPA